MLSRTTLTRRLVQRLTNEEAVVAGLGNTNFDFIVAGHRPQNFYMLGSMGLACPIALGVALVQAKARGDRAGRRRFDPDGAGCFATIGNVRPHNLTIIIWDNGMYQITGKQAAATGGATDIVAVARGAGIVASEWVHDETHFGTLTDGRFEDGGPRLLAVKIDDRPGKGPPMRDPVLIRENFMRGLGKGRSRELG